LKPIDIHAVILVFYSTPVKPGSVHRLMPTSEFELRLVEAAVAADAAVEAYERGRQLRRGSRDSRTMMLGSLISDYLKLALEKTGEQPLTGPIVASVVTGAIIGYAEAGGESPRQATNRLIQYALYRSPPSQAASFIEGLESIGAREEVLLLDEKGASRRQVELHGLTLGDVFEILGEKDSGYWLNIRNYSRILETASIAEQASSLVEASIRAFVDVAKRVGEDVNISPLKEMLARDAQLRRRGAGTARALGGALAAVLLAYSERVDMPIVPKHKG